MSDEPELTEVVSAASGRTIRTRVLVELESLAEGVVHEFEQHAAEWRDGYAIWLGWGPVTLREDNGGFVIVSPNYASDPRREETSDLTLAIWMATSLSAVTRAAEVDPQDVSYTDDLICAKGWDESSMLALSRTATDSQGDSGWFVEPFPPTDDRNWTTDRLERVAAWSMLQQRRAVARALALPIGVSAIVDGDDVRAVVRESDREVLATGV